jgi:hypothetical protein
MSPRTATTCAPLGALKTSLSLEAVTALLLAKNLSKRRACRRIAMSDNQRPALPSGQYATAKAGACSIEW